jgi:membrane associated rhomboid family serine protease
MSAEALFGGFPEPVLQAYGAKQNSLINQQHEWWRFVTPMFLHINLPHLLVNMYSLWMVGPYVEKLYGSAKFVVFWVVTGIAGVVASYLTVVQPDSPLSKVRFIFKTVDGFSAGASGALFGLVGVLFVFGIKFRHELPDGFRRAFGTGLLPVIMINLFIGYLGQRFIDNAAHLGGLMSGAALALVVSYRRPGDQSAMALTWQVLQVAALALVAVSFVKVAQHFEVSASVSATNEIRQVGPTDKTTEFLLFAKAINEGQEAFNSGDPKAIDAAVTALEGAPPLDIKADQLKRKLQTLLKDAKVQPAETQPTPTKQRVVPGPASGLQSDFKLWKAEYEEWLKAVGKQYSESP